MPNQMFKGASNFTISGGNFINQSNSRASALDKLSAAAAHSALHNAPARTDESRCHRHTRTSVLDYLECWAQGVCTEGASIFWLYGGAGAGKSAIMQTVAERCVAQGLALGSFFFSRSDPTRNAAEVFTPTLVCQLAMLFPPALQVLEPIIDQNPLIFKTSFQTQFFSLLVPALQHLVQLGIISDAPLSPRVFLIDGLDECNGPVQQQGIIQAVVAVCHKHCIPVKFIIASRQEHQISTSFRWYNQENRILGTISLSEDPNAENDIRRFVEDELQRICSLHPFNHMIPSGWLNLYDINRLVWKSSSHFIYASTAIKYIWSAKESPVRSLQLVLGLEVPRTTSPFSDLDALYRHILGSATHRDRVLQILAHCFFAKLSMSISMICLMIGCSKNDLFIFMSDVIPLMAVSKPALANKKENEVKVLHASLKDFLLDQSRSGSLYLNKEVYLASKLERCFELFHLYSWKQRTASNWLTDTANQMLEHDQWLQGQIISTIERSGQFFATQEVLRRYSLRNFYQCQLRFWKVKSPVPYLLEDLFSFFRVVYSIKTADGLMQFHSYLQDLFDILESYISLTSTPLGPAILPLIFSGYPTQAVSDLQYYQWLGNPSYMLMAGSSLFIKEPNGFVTTLGAIISADLASISHNVNTSPKCLAVAAEAILGYLVEEVEDHYSSTYSAHRLWLHQTKPVKHVMKDAPGLTSAMHAYILAPLKDQKKSLIYNLHSPSKGLGCCAVVYRLGRRQKEQRMVATFLDALLWVLPKASFSEKIVLYSKRTLTRNIYRLEAGLVRRLRKCLDDYTIRMENVKLEELDRRIANGGVNALIEKSRMLHLDAQD